MGGGGGLSPHEYSGHGGRLAIVAAHGREPDRKSTCRFIAKDVGPITRMTQRRGGAPSGRRSADWLACLGGATRRGRFAGTLARLVLGGVEAWPVNRAG
jgi:hypothetical protein